MPAELTIALIVIIAIGWVIYQLVAAMLRSADATQKGIQGYLVRRRSQRLQKARAAQAPYVFFNVPDDLSTLEKQLRSVELALYRQKETLSFAIEKPHWKQYDFTKHSFSSQSAAVRPFDISDIQRVLRPNDLTWTALEERLVQKACSYTERLSPAKLRDPVKLSTFDGAPKEAIFHADEIQLTAKDIERFWIWERDAVVAHNERRRALLARVETINRDVADWNAAEHARWAKQKQEIELLTNREQSRLRVHAASYEKACLDERAEFSEILTGYKAHSKESVIRRTAFLLSSLVLPTSLPRFWKIDYDEVQKILIVEVALPDVVHKSPIKTVSLKSGVSQKPLNQTERKEQIPRIHPAIMLRIAYEICRNDVADAVTVLALNGWVDFLNPTTGLESRAYTASLLVTPKQVVPLVISNVDPVAAFAGLKGKSAGRIIDIVPIEPQLSLKRTDARFVDGRAVLDGMTAETNLALMEWQEFEHLIRELFEKEFSDKGAEVKITQASRDRGVDAVVFNPDPIQGGKYIIQAKRYTNTVDVSAVRDLCAVVRKEGASRGILVATSSFGSDAYKFAHNEPITLLDGGRLLGLLQKHGYSFRIDLAEARRARLTN